MSVQLELFHNVFLDCSELFSSKDGVEVCIVQISLVFWIIFGTFLIFWWKHNLQLGSTKNLDENANIENQEYLTHRKVLCQIPHLLNIFIEFTAVFVLLLLVFWPFRRKLDIVIRLNISLWSFWISRILRALRLFFLQTFGNWCLPSTSWLGVLTPFTHFLMNMMVCSNDLLSAGDISSDKRCYLITILYDHYIKSLFIDDV